MLAIAHHASSTKAGQQDPAISNRTSAIEVVSVKPANTAGYRVVIKNVAAKTINGYSLGYDDGQYLIGDLTGTRKQGLAPGEELTLPGIPPTATIVVRYVVFDDNSVDGDSVAASELQERRLGIREQLTRIVELVRATPGVEELKARIEALPETSQDGVWAGAGMRYAKQDALMALEQIDKKDVQAGLNKLIEESNSRIARLPQRVNH
jgi:hypothetical protein